MTILMVITSACLLNAPQVRIFDEHRAAHAAQGRAAAAARPRAAPAGGQRERGGARDAVPALLLTSRPGRPPTAM